MSARALLPATLALLVAACASSVGASPTPGVTLGTAELKYRVMDAGGRVEFCDPDFYPIARADEAALARLRIGDIQGDADTYAAITKRVGTDALAVYREWKALNALSLHSQNDAFGFVYVARKTDTSFERVEGRVSQRGQVTVIAHSPTPRPPCPICLARGTRIATPSGEMPVEALHAGDLVWTVGADGARVAAPLIAVGMTPVPATHEVVHLMLSDGREVSVSPGHPTGDDRRVGALRAGDLLDGSRVLSVDRVRYDSGFTFDVLPAGPTGLYWANGVLFASTLSEHAIRGVPTSQG